MSGTVEGDRYNGYTHWTAGSIIEKFFPEQEFETMSVELNGEEHKVPIWVVREGEIIAGNGGKLEVKEETKVELVGGRVDGRGSLVDLQVRVWNGREPSFLGFINHQAQ